MLKAEPGLNEYEPSAFSVKVPPLEPVIAAPTLVAWPLTAETCSVSPSGSVSLASTPCAASAVRLTPWLVLSVSLTAVGAGFLTSHEKSCDTEAPLLSVAVTVTE
ncbi:hypothetical protein D3C75_1164150 [compost metagenome]